MRISRKDTTKSRSVAGESSVMYTSATGHHDANASQQLPHHEQTKPNFFQDIMRLYTLASCSRSIASHEFTRMQNAW